MSNSDYYGKQTIASQKSYPEIYYPEKLTEFKNDWQNIIAETMVSSPPNKPDEVSSKPDKPYFVIELVFLGFIISSFIGIIAKSWVTFFIILFISAFFTLIFYLSEKINYPSKLKEYNEKVSIYNRAYARYETKKENREIELQTLKKTIKSNENKYTDERLKYIENLLKPVILAKKPFHENKQGRSEKIFFNYLLKHFGEDIKKDKVIEIFRSGTAYIPDFIFEHSQSNLVIDIEIDEPYSLSNNEPIHFYNNENDKKRNYYYVNKNWIVVRFSEKQIINTPQSCCKEIAKVILDLTGDDSYYLQLIHSTELNTQKKWSYEEAEIMAQINQREQFKNNQEELKNIFFEAKVIKGIRTWSDSEKRIKIALYAIEITSGILKGKVESCFQVLEPTENQNEYIELPLLPANSKVKVSTFIRNKVLSYRIIKIVAFAFTVWQEGADWVDVPELYKGGFWIKNEMYQLETLYSKSNEITRAIRDKWEASLFNQNDLVNYSENNQKYVLNKKVSAHLLISFTEAANVKYNIGNLKHILRTIKDNNKNFKVEDIRIFLEGFGIQLSEGAVEDIQKNGYKIINQATGNEVKITFSDMFKPSSEHNFNHGIFEKLMSFLEKVIQSKEDLIVEYNGLNNPLEQIRTIIEQLSIIEAKHSHLSGSLSFRDQIKSFDFFKQSPLIQLSEIKLETNEILAELERVKASLIWLKNKRKEKKISLEWRNYF
jgi:hypothetical protein